MARRRNDSTAISQRPINSSLDVILRPTYCDDDHLSRQLILLLLLLLICFFFISALTMSVEQQEKQPTCKNGAQAIAKDLVKEPSK